MDITDEELKLLADVIGERLDDDKDMLSDSDPLRERESIKTVWALEDLMGRIGEEQKARRSEGARRTFVLNETDVKFWGRIKAFETAVEKRLRELRDMIPEDVDDDLQQFHVRLDAQNSETVRTNTRVGALEERAKTFHAYAVKHWIQTNALRRQVEDLQAKLQALELQADDRWVRTQQADTRQALRVGELENALEAHVGETETRH